MNIDDRRYELESFLDKRLGDYPDSHILLMHEMQLILQDDNAPRQMKNIAEFVFRLANDGNSEWLSKFEKEKYRKSIDYGAFADTLLDDWWSAANKKYEQEQDNN